MLAAVNFGLVIGGVSIALLVVAAIAGLMDSKGVSAWRNRAEALDADLEDLREKHARDIEKLRASMAEQDRKCREEIQSLKGGQEALSGQLVDRLAEAMGNRLDGFEARLTHMLRGDGR